MGILGGAKARPLVLRQGGATDRLFQASFAGTALSGGSRARKKSEKHRGPCGESRARDRLRVRGITGIRRPRLVATGLSLEFALSALHPAERGKAGPYSDHSDVLLPELAASWDGMSCV